MHVDSGNVWQLSRGLRYKDLDGTFVVGRNQKADLVTLSPDESCTGPGWPSQIMLATCDWT